MAVTPENGWLGGRRRMSRPTGTDTILQDLWQRPNATCLSSAACPITNNPAGRVEPRRKFNRHQKHPSSNLVIENHLSVAIALASNTIMVVLVFLPATMAEYAIHVEAAFT
ncbi:hypothetical protein QC761_0095890 [Podospora bellae-mahoneyi]|uniref:Uncharacterized protein n=1 Tax=Podospora bellae-mahoneyi TaxID=2093777 RepID=A0ABR0FAX4_9PEZI|nr:hypothetical protein QC761_0095890 [Podospora bellae-mahoneyi]